MSSRRRQRAKVDTAPVSEPPAQPLWKPSDGEEAAAHERPSARYYVAKGRAVTCGGVVLGPGHVLDPNDFPGGVQNLERLVARGTVARAR